VVGPLSRSGTLDLQNVNPEDNGPSRGGVDVFVSCEESIFPFTPITLAAKRWIDENVQPDARWFANALVVEWRYAAERVAAMRADGLVLA
jgi:hypothetical protein